MNNARMEEPAGCTRSLEISVVIPAYNEARRLPRFLETVWPYMRDVFGESYEVIVVDDGSSDRTGEVVEEMRSRWPQLQVVRHDVNRGKGSAVRTGVRSSMGDIVLVSDADGACPLREESKLRSKLMDGADIAIGSRRVGQSLERSRVWYRGTLGWCFALLTRKMTGLDLHDTQCGFKMFRGPVARQLLGMCPRDDYLFDVVVLMSAKSLGFRIEEVGVSWTEMAGSQLRLVRDSWKMVTGLLTVRRQVKRALRKPVSQQEPVSQEPHFKAMYGPASRSLRKVR